mmetsp:Transcript_42472/g.108700  ORF Transcript_42472/g.108700 Transcript_42472/m.108700 type:complete len:229 (-) Transcript_42472:158-844(-)
MTTLQTSFGPHSIVGACDRFHEPREEQLPMTFRLCPYSAWNLRLNVTVHTPLAEVSPSERTMCASTWLGDGAGAAGAALALGAAEDVRRAGGGCRAGAVASVGRLAARRAASCTLFRFSAASSCLACSAVLHRLRYSDRRASRRSSNSERHSDTDSAGGPPRRSAWLATTRATNRGAARGIAARAVDAGDSENAAVRRLAIALPGKTIVLRGAPGPTLTIIFEERQLR